MTTNETRPGDWRQTFSGISYWPLDPRSEEICVVDIAHHLALQCRFAGSTSGFYSVAEHCLRVAALVKKWLTQQEATAGAHLLYYAGALLHDAAEAYLTDIPTPLKKQTQMAFYRDLERRTLEVIAEKFRIPYLYLDSAFVRRADLVMLCVEARDLMPDPSWARKYCERPDIGPEVKAHELLQPMVWWEAERIYRDTLCGLHHDLILLDQADSGCGPEGP